MNEEPAKPRHPRWRFDQWSARRKYNKYYKKYVYLWMPRADRLRVTGRKRTLVRPPERVAFGTSVRNTRIRFLLTQKQLGEKFGVNHRRINDVEVGKIAKSHKRPWLMEKLRIWVETNKPLSQRRRENSEFDPFADLEQLVKEKEQDNG